MTRLRARLRFDADHPSLAGHFPGHPIVPGVLLLDAALQALERAQPAGDAASGGWHIGNAKFHRPVLPGESLRLECRPQSEHVMRVEIHAAEALVLSALIERSSP